MQINESTYETFFLLYIDNELSAKERLDVEDFIAKNPSYADSLEALKATVVGQDANPYPFKAQLKKVSSKASDEMDELAHLDEMDAAWDRAYKNYIAEDMKAIQGLPPAFKDSLKKNNESKGLIIHAFGFNQNKFTYAAIAALFMVFIGYQQLTKTTEVNSIVTNSNAANSNIESVPRSSIQQEETNQRNASQNTFKKDIVIVAAPEQELRSKAQKIKTNEAPIRTATQKASMAMTASTEPRHFNLTNTNIAASPAVSDKEINTVAINMTQLEIITLDTDEAITAEEKTVTNYEIIDTEDADRTIYIANFEIDGNRLRGLKRKVTSLFKANKSDRNK
jgi:hypothetical protein